MADGKVVFQIDGDARGVKTTIKDVTSDIEKETKKWDNAVKESSDDMTKSFAKAFDIERLKNWGIQAAKAIGKFIGEAISAASDLAEVQNVVDVTFGDSAKKIDAWAQAAGNNFGLTELQAKRYASTIGAMLKSQGTAQKDVLEMSESLAGLAADMASFYNLDFDTAFEKILAGISGETMPLKQLGINMSVANLEAFALSQGIEKSYSAMSQGEQTMLRYQYLMQATADAQGDFARTSDGFANATRRLQTSIETIKAKVGGLLMQVIEPLTTGIAGILDLITGSGRKTVLDEFNAIDDELGKNLYTLEKTYDQANDILTVMKRINDTAVEIGGNSTTFEQLFRDISAVEKSGGSITDYISGLGLDVDYITREYQVWQESLNQIKTLIPSVTDAVDAETLAIQGGTDAIQTNLEEWKSAEEQKLRWTAYYTKARALEEKKSEMYSYEYDVFAAQAKVDRLYKQLAANRAAIFDEKGNLDVTASLNNARGLYGNDKFLKPQLESYERLVREYADASKVLWIVQTALESETNDYADAEQDLANVREYLISLYGDESDAAKTASDTVSKYTDRSADDWNTLTMAAKTAIQALADYYQTVRDSTESTVNSVVKGFETLERPTTELEKKRDKLIEQQNELNRSTKDGEKRYQELQTQIDELNKSMDEYSPKGMQDALKSQLAFMDEYIKNLEKARELGLSDALLASLSDGSAQSAEYLSALVSNPEQAKEVDALYQQVEAKKGEFTDALTEQKLTVDETYNAMVEKAKTAIGELDLGGEAKEAMGETVAGLAQGISDHVPDVKEAVDALLSELNRLNGFGINISIGSFGDLFTDGLIDGEHATGLDYVPFDGYLAGLHEGEGILTAEENRIWQRFKNGAQPQTMDYDALGATMRENVQAGGNVYLDGKTVGRVISDQQGNAYRQLQRSGWQQ